MPPIPENLQENDRELIEAVRLGKVWQPNSKTPSPEDLANSAFVAGMPAIQAITIYALCLGLWDGVEVDPKGININGARIEGKLDLSYATVRVPLKLMGCHFAKQVNISRANLPFLALSSSRLEQGLHGDGARIASTLQCRNGFVSLKEVRLLGAEISGNMSFMGAKLDGKGRRALSAERIWVKGNVFCHNGFRVTGAASFRGAHIDGQFYWQPKRWNGKLTLAHARVGQWRDGWTGRGWECEGAPEIDLRDFVYGNFVAGASNTDAESRIAWVRAAQGDNFFPGLYETLTTVLRANGDDSGANNVARAKRRHQTAHRVRTSSGLHRFGWVWGHLLDLTTGYGYHPWRGVGTLLVFLCVGAGIFLDAGPTPKGSGIIKPAIAVVYTQPLERFTVDPAGVKTSVGRTDSVTSHAIRYNLPIEYPPFNSFWYSLDTLIPLVDLSQETAWSPSPIGSIGTDFWGWMVLGYLYIHILAGWVLTTLTVVAMTGLIKKE